MKLTTIAWATALALTSSAALAQATYAPSIGPLSPMHGSHLFQLTAPQLIVLGTNARQFAVVATPLKG